MEKDRLLNQDFVESLKLPEKNPNSLKLIRALEPQTAKIIKASMERMKNRASKSPNSLK